MCCSYMLLLIPCSGRQPFCTSSFLHTIPAAITMIRPVQQANNTHIGAIMLGLFELGGTSPSGACGLSWPAAMRALNCASCFPHACSCPCTLWLPSSYHSQTHTLI